MSPPGVDWTRPGSRRVDPALPFLARALDPVEMEPRFATLLGETEESPPRVALEAARIVRHKWGRRALVEYALRIDPPPAAGPRLDLLGKCRARGTDVRTFGVARALRAAGLDGREGVEIPRPVGVVPDLRMWLQEKVPGASAWCGLVGDHGELLARRIAEALHALHAAPLASSRVHAIADELRNLEVRLRLVAGSRPAWAARIERLLAACRRRAAGVAATPLRGIHRDLHPDQVIVCGDRLALVDLDLYCAGDPALDAGNLLAHLGEWALRIRGDPCALEGRERAFSARFLELTARPREAALRTWTDLGLARHVWVSTLFPERRPLTGALLELCEYRLDVASRPAWVRAPRDHSR